MIINTTKTPLSAFSAAQRLAMRGDRCVHAYVRTSEEFYDVLDNIQEHVSMVIVENTSNRFVLNNDICNSVSCPVVTLDVEIDVEEGHSRHRFLDYDPE